MLIPSAYPTLDPGGLGLDEHLDPAAIMLLKAEAEPSRGSCSSSYDEGALVPVPVLRLFPSLPRVTDPAASQLRAPDEYAVVVLADSDSDRVSGTEAALL